MEKLLHERLREIADEKEDEPYSSGIIEALCKEFGVCENKSSYAIDLNNCLKAIADEIEKFYIPRPRFEDGEPDAVFRFNYCPMCSKKLGDE